MNSDNKTAPKPRNRFRPRSRSCSRESKETKMQKLVDSNFSQVLKALECPVCLEIMSGEILLCETGHSICGLCRKNIVTAMCPTCRSKITSQRNICLEQMAQSIKLHCPNKQYGCQLKLLSNQMENHLNVCNFKILFCPMQIMLDCNWEGRKNETMDHVKKNHPKHAEFSFNSMYIDESCLKKFYVDIQILSLYQELFILDTFVDFNEKLIFFNLRFIGHENIAKKWKYTINIIDQNEPLKKIEITEICTDTKSNLNKIWKNGECVVLSLKILQNYIHKKEKKLFFYIVPVYNS